MVMKKIVISFSVNPSSDVIIDIYFMPDITTLINLCFNFTLLGFISVHNGLNAKYFC